MPEEPDLPADVDVDQALASPALAGTVQLARAALDAPAPPEHAETESRRQVETLMQEAALSPRVLREADAPLPRRAWWQRLTFWKR